MTVSVQRYVQIQMKLNAYIATFGCEIVDMHLDSLPVKLHKRNNRHVGAYIENKLCEAYGITRYQLMESTGRKDITEARELLCVLVKKYLQLSHTNISVMFGRSRHFAKRMIHSFDDKLKGDYAQFKEQIAIYKRLDLLIANYMDFNPVSKSAS